ncbi:MAG: hypothetical protein ABIP68_09195, partial [Ferruginibacter sp.]
MRLNRFKAKISLVTKPRLINELDVPINREFEFSRSKIFFTDDQSLQKLTLEPPSEKHSTESFRNGMKYKLDKVYNEYDIRIFQITVGNNNFTSPITLTWFNKIKCNLIHNRYFIQRKKD